MPESPALKAAREAVDAATTALADTVQPIADRIAALSDQLANGMSPDEQAAAAVTLQSDADGLSATATALRALGSTPSA